MANVIPANRLRAIPVRGGSLKKTIVMKISTPTP